MKRAVADPNASRTWIMLGIGLVALLALALGAYVVSTRPVMDEAIQGALLKVQEVRSYTQHVTTETVVSDRSLKLTGVYRVDYELGRYESLATTTLTLPEPVDGSLEHEFTLHNISIADDVYTKIQTSSPFLAKNIPHSAVWRHFTRTTIPQEFQNIAIAGPVLDNLKILSANGEYLTFEGRGEDEALDGQVLSTYFFTLSGEIPEETGSLRALIERIGPQGRITVWIDAEQNVRRMLFENPDYRSETYVSAINTPLNIASPVENHSGTLTE